ncbi:MAG: F0F1 ATP synthase subunit B [Arsenophonus sp. ER-LPS3-MAG3]
MNLNATFLGQAISFFFFVLFCMKYVWPPIITAIEKRQKEISDSLSNAEQAKKNLELAKIDTIVQLEKTKLEAQSIIEQANKQRIQIIKEAKIEAEIERNKIISQTKVEIDTNIRLAHEELRKKVAMLAILGAEKIIERSIDISINNDIIDKLVNEL